MDNIVTDDIWIDFVMSLPNWINFQVTTKYTIQYWVKHFECLLMYSLDTEFQKKYEECYINILKHKLQPIQDININRYNIVLDNKKCLQKNSVIIT